jgi:hypothetical protein
MVLMIDGIHLNCDTMVLMIDRDNLDVFSDHHEYHGITV